MIRGESVVLKLVVLSPSKAMLLVHGVAAEGEGIINIS